MTALAACSDDSDGGSGTGGDGGDGGSSDAIKVGMALTGPRNDGGYAQAHYEGLEVAKQSYDIETTVVDNIGPGQPRVDALNNLAATSDLVIAVGAEFAPAGVQVAPQHPDVSFVVINGQLNPDAPNLHVYYAREGVPAYVAGVVATELTRTNTVGFVGGEEIPPTIQSDDAFKAAIKATDPSIDTLSINTGDFNNVADAKQAAATEIGQGADVLFLMLDNAFEGAQQAVQESGKDVKVFSIIVPRCETADNIVGCATLNSSKMVAQIIDDYEKDALPTDVQAYGVENPDVQSFELCSKWQTPELTKLVDDTIEKINNGDIEMPDGV
jgi:basic membrane protein A